MLREVRLVHRLLFGFQFVGMHYSSITVMPCHSLSLRVVSLLDIHKLELLAYLSCLIQPNWRNEETKKTRNLLKSTNTIPYFPAQLPGDSDVISGSAILTHINGLATILALL